MRTAKLVTATLALLILSLALTACDGSVSIDSLTGFQAPSGSLGSDKQIKAPNDTTAGQSADISSNFEDRSSSKLIADSPEDSDSSELHLYCEITAVTETAFTACDITYEVDTTENLTTMFTVGEFYEIEYILNDDGTITILKFELEDYMDSSSSVDSSDDDSSSSSYTDNSSSGSYTDNDDDDSSDDDSSSGSYTDNDDDDSSDDYSDNNNDDNNNYNNNNSENND